MPDPILVGRNEDKLKAIAVCARPGALDHGSCRALSPIQKTRFTSTRASTGMREQNVLQAIAAGKHVYCEKPLSTTWKAHSELPAPLKRPASSRAWFRTSFSFLAFANFAA